MPVRQDPYSLSPRNDVDEFHRTISVMGTRPTGMLDPRLYAIQSITANAGSAVARKGSLGHLGSESLPHGEPAGRAELRSYTPTLREWIENGLASVTGDNRDAMRTAKRVTGVLDFTPAGAPLGAYDAGREVGSGLQAFENRPWTGAGQVGLGLAGMALAAGPGRHGMKHLVGQGSWESVPGRTTTHLPSLVDSSHKVRAEHMSGVRDILTDETGRDRLSVGFGLPTEKSFEGPGVFEGKINPGMQTQIRFPPDPSGKRIDPASHRAMDAVEGTRAMLLGQDAFAWHVPGPLGEAMKRSEVLDIDLKGTIGDDQMLQVVRTLQDRFGPGVLNRIAPVPTPSGFRMLNIGSIKAKDFVSAGRDIAKQMMSAPKPGQRARVDGNYVANDWERNPLGQEYIKLLENPEFQKPFDEHAPTLARRLAEVDRDFATRTGISGESEVQKLRKIVADEGYEGLMKAIKKGAVSVAAVGALLGTITAPRKEASRGQAEDERY